MSRIQPAMADGRSFTNYLTACVMDSVLANRHNVYGPAYRHWLQHNAGEAVQESRKLDVCYATPCFILPYPVTPEPRFIDPIDPNS